MQLITKFWERERERERDECYLCESVIGSNVYSETKLIFFTNSAVVAPSLVRSHVLFKFLNDVTDKIVRVVLTTLALMLRCVQTICVAMCFPYIIKQNVLPKIWTRSADLILLFTVFICLASVVVGFGYFAVVRPFEIIWWSDIYM